MDKDSLGAHTKVNIKEGDLIGAILVAPWKDADTIVDKKFVIKDTGINCRLNLVNDAENCPAMGMHCMSDRSFHKKLKYYDRCFNCALNKCFPIQS